MQHILAKANSTGHTRQYTPGRGRCNECKKTGSELWDSIIQGPVMYGCRGGCTNYDICYKCIINEQRNNGVGGHRRTHNLDVVSYKR